MYFNNDIKIHNFKNESYFNSCLACMFRADSAQKWTNDLTSKMNVIQWEILMIQGSFSLI